MRVVFSGLQWPKNLTGVHKSTVNLALSLRCSSENVTVAFIIDQELNILPRLNLAGIQVIDCRISNRGSKSELLRQWSPEIFVSDYPSPSCTLPRHCKKVLRVHDCLPLEIPGYLGRNPIRRCSYIARLLSGTLRSSLVITNSYYSQKQLKRYLSIESMVIPNTFKAAPSQDPALPRSGYLYVGGFDPRKNIEALIVEFNRLYIQGFVKEKLVVAGSPEHLYPSLEKLISKAVKLGSVVCTGYLSESELIQYYKSSRALVYPSTYEGFGMPVLEAMSYGCPVISTPFTSIPEVGGDSILYFDPNITGSLASQIMLLENSSELCSSLSMLGLRQAKIFSYENVGALLYRQLASLLP